MEYVNGVAADYLERLSVALARLDRAQIDRAVGTIRAAWEGGKQIITFGNGGSALTALHFITDWNKAIFLASGRPFRGRTLIDNAGLVSAYSNDISYSDVFLEQLRNILQPGDLVIAISGSGNSENVIRAIDYANQNGAVTLGLCGHDGGALRIRAQYFVWADVHDMQLCEDAHAIFGHIVMQALCVRLGTKPSDHA